MGRMGEGLGWGDFLKMGGMGEGFPGGHLYSSAKYIDRALSMGAHRDKKQKIIKNTKIHFWALGDPGGPRDRRAP